MRLCTAVRKVKWRKTKIISRGVCCSGCGWAKGVGHDWMCKFVERRNRR